MTSTRYGEADVAALARSISGTIVRPDDEKYDEVRMIHNAAYDRRPRLVVQPDNAADVSEAVRFARRYDLDLAVHSGGHSLTGYSTSDDMVIEFSRMKAITIDPEARTVRVEPGLTWGEVSEATHVHGLAIPSGDTGTVGVGGLTTGGGIGWLVRKYGLTIDSLLACEVVTADGRLLRASQDENADLFWAVRGGGGNFGIVTAFEFRAHPVGMIVGGAVFYDAADGEAVFRRYVDYAQAAPRELSTIAFVMHAPPAPFIPADRVGSQVIVIAVTYAGDLDEGQRVVAPLRSLGTPIADVIAPMPYPAIYALTAEAGVKGHHMEVRSTFADELSDDAIAAMMTQMRAISSPFGLVQVRVLGGAMADVPSEATAFSHRQAQIMVSGINVWMNPAETPVHVAWTEGFGRAMAPYSNGNYVNFLSDEGEERIRDAYSAETYARLVELKNRYDPTNLFRLNQNIRPSAQSQERADEPAA